MPLLLNLSIRRKLMAIIMLAVSVALLVAGAVFFAYQLVAIRRATSARLSSTAQIIGTNSAGALTFDDAGIAEKTLAALAAEPDILAAVLFDRDGRPFAKYVRTGDSVFLPDRPGADGVRTEASRLVLFGPIVLDRERIGTIFLMSGLEAQNALLRLFAELVLGVIGFTLVIALGLSSRLQRVVSEPVLTLSRLTRQVSEGKDYSLRADVRSRDELGQLADGFNEMLSRIQAHEAELHKLNRRYRLQGGCNLAVVRARSEQLLLEDFCRLLVDVGGYRSASIAYGDSTGPRALSQVAEARTGGAPGGGEARSGGEPGPTMTIPMVSSEHALGVLTVGADQGRVIDADEQVMLSELAGDLVFGIMTLRTREQRAQAESELKNAQRFLADVIESMPSTLISIRADGTITQWNDAATKLAGIPTSEAVGRNLWEVLPAFARYHSLIPRMLEARRSQEFRKETLEIGTERKYFNVSLFPLVTTQFAGIVIRADDVTEAERRELQLRQSQKMETVGTLAGGLAHDFNNVLGGIIGTLSLLKFRLESADGIGPDELRDSIAVIEASAKRAADTVQHLLALSRKQELSFVPVNLNETVDHVMDICRNTLDKSVELDARLAAVPAMINSDPTQMEQVLLNLCVNAAHAMTIMRKDGQRWGGRLTVGLDRLSADPLFCEHHPEASVGTYWRLSVRDDGVGMETNLLSKIFDPFFTTKNTEKGTGLGLAMVYNIVHQHGGFIDVYSEPGAGSTFTVYLPALVGRPAEAARKPEDEELPRGEGLVLVVDDEPFIRRIAQQMLQACGYTVVLAENGQQGIDVFRERHGEIALVLLDMNMPKKSGREAWLEMRQIDPSVRVVMASGFRNDDRMDDVLDHGLTAFIQKPYTLRTLARTVHEALHR